jgi:hypothetical protein
MTGRNPPSPDEQNVGQLLEILTATHGSNQTVDRTGTSG